MKVSRDWFVSLLEMLSNSWSIPDATRAVECYTDDAIYMQPPNIQFYQGKDQLLKYFGALTEGYYLKFHNIWFNEDTQVGSAEFSFGKSNDDTADTGVCVVQLTRGKISFWREYFVKGPSNFQIFISLTDKDWKWDIGNYP